MNEAVRGVGPREWPRREDQRGSSRCRPADLCHRVTACRQGILNAAAAGRTGWSVGGGGQGADGRHPFRRGGGPLRLAEFLGGGLEGQVADVAGHGDLQCPGAWRRGRCTVAEVAASGGFRIGRCVRFDEWARPERSVGVSTGRSAGRCLRMPKTGPVVRFPARLTAAGSSMAAYGRCGTVEPHAILMCARRP